uniref:Uncharacterized protein n=2 Tax=Anguilla anguilla TaxID=7936 RepID=A0A0E9TVI9_ANGAN
MSETHFYIVGSWVPNIRHKLSCKCSEFHKFSAHTCCQYFHEFLNVLFVNVFWSQCLRK